MRRFCAIFLLLAAPGLIGCERQRPRPGEVEAGPLVPVSVKAFEFGTPDVVLVVTGETNGTLEACDCVPIKPGGLAYRGGLIASYRAAFENVLVVDTGDALVGAGGMIGQEPAGLRNRAVLEGYRMLGYDVLVLGQQEWEVPVAQRSELFAGGDVALLSTTVSPARAGEALPIRRVVKRQWPDVKLAIISRIRPEDFLLYHRSSSASSPVRFSPPEEFRETVGRLKRDGYMVVVVAFGAPEAADQAARDAPADLIVRGRTLDSAKTFRRVAGKPIVEVGGSDFAGIVAMKITGGRIDAIEYRRELVDRRWPLDKRMLHLYRRFLGDLARAAKARRESPTRPGASTAG